MSCVKIRKRSWIREKSVAVKPIKYASRNPNPTDEKKRKSLFEIAVLPITLNITGIKKITVRTDLPARKPIPEARPRVYI